MPAGQLDRRRRSRAAPRAARRRGRAAPARRRARCSGAPESGSPVAAAHRAEQVPELGQRLAAGALDQAGRLDGPLRVLLEHLARAAPPGPPSRSGCARARRAARARCGCARAAMARRSSSSRACCARSAFSASSRASSVWLRSVLPGEPGNDPEEGDREEDVARGRRRSHSVTDHRGAERESDHARAPAHVAPGRVARGDEHQHRGEQVRRLRQPDSHDAPARTSVHSDGDERAACGARGTSTRDRRHHRDVQPQRAPRARSSSTGRSPRSRSGRTRAPGRACARRAR